MNLCLLYLVAVGVWKVEEEEELVRRGRRSLEEEVASDQDILRIDSWPHGIRC